jgi:hypothetical protein
MWWFIAWLLCGLIGSLVAGNRGNSGLGGLAWGLLLGPLGIVIVALTPPNPLYVEQQQLQQGLRRECPACMELVRPMAIVCPHCGRDLPPQRQQS